METERPGYERAATFCHGRTRFTLLLPFRVSGVQAFAYFRLGVEGF